MSTFYEMVWDFWTPKGAEGPPCILNYAPAVTLHEIKPRSTYRNWRDDPLNSVPVCHECHEKVQANTGGWEGRLVEARTIRLQAIEDWKGTRELWDTEKEGMDE